MNFKLSPYQYHALDPRTRMAASLSGLTGFSNAAEVKGPNGSGAQLIPDSRFKTMVASVLQAPEVGSGLTRGYRAALTPSADRFNYMDGGLEDGLASVPRYTHAQGSNRNPFVPTVARFAGLGLLAPSYSTIQPTKALTPTTTSGGMMMLNAPVQYNVAAPLPVAPTTSTRERSGRVIPTLTFPTKTVAPPPPATASLSSSIKGAQAQVETLLKSMSGSLSAMATLVKAMGKARDIENIGTAYNRVLQLKGAIDSELANMDRLANSDFERMTLAGWKAVAGSKASKMMEQADIYWQDAKATRDINNSNSQPATDGGGGASTGGGDTAPPNINPDAVAPVDTNLAPATIGTGKSNTLLYVGAAAVGLGALYLLFKKA